MAEIENGNDELIKTIEELENGAEQSEFIKKHLFGGHNAGSELSKKSRYDKETRTDDGSVTFILWITFGNGSSF